MKFIETPSLEYINSLLDAIEFGDQAISGKLEAYSCALAVACCYGGTGPPAGRPRARGGAIRPWD